MSHDDITLPSFRQRRIRTSVGLLEDFILFLDPSFSQQLLGHGDEGQHLDAVDELHVATEPGGVVHLRGPDNTYCLVVGEWGRVGAVTVGHLPISRS